MQTVHTIAHFDADGSIQLKAPGLASAGDHRVMLVLEETASDAAEAMALSAASFSKVWNNPEDAVYDTL